MKKAFLFLAASFMLLYSCKETQAKVCPKEETVRESLGKLIKRNFKIESLKPMEGMKGICEVVVKVGLRPIVLYTDSVGKSYIHGNAFNVETKENLTQRTVNRYMTVSKSILSELEKHVNMTYGKGDKFVYYITDPDCPFCRRFSPILKEWAKENNVQIKVILFPLPIHPEAKPKAIAMVCDGKGYDDLHRKIKTKNQCERGKKAIEENMTFLHEIGVSGTPTVIGMNGRYVVGLPHSSEELNSLIQ